MWSCFIKVRHIWSVLQNKTSTGAVPPGRASPRALHPEGAAPPSGDHAVGRRRGPGLSAPGPTARCGELCAGATSATSRQLRLLGSDPCFMAMEGSPEHPPAHNSINKNHGLFLHIYIYINLPRPSLIIHSPWLSRQYSREFVSLTSIAVDRWSRGAIVLLLQKEIGMKDLIGNAT